MYASSGRRLVRTVLSLVTVSGLAVAGGAIAGEKATTLVCHSNLMASRDFTFQETRWVGREPEGGFNVQTRKDLTAGTFFSLRDKVFSGLNTRKPGVRSVTRLSNGTSNGEDFEATVLSRTRDAVFLMWKNDYGNKVWVAVIDLSHRKASISELFQGATSVGGQLETMDCE